MRGCGNRFQHTYEGLKRIQHLNFAAAGRWFSAYLWGIETSLHGFNELHDFVFSAYLWGIETYLPQNSYHTPHNVFSIPMRDWNRSNRSNSFISLMVFSIPMRDWNSPPHKTAGSHIFRFQHTYEGLKLPRLALISFWGGTVFSIPMRDWNNVAFFTTSSPCRSFQHTYEGLKLDKPQCLPQNPSSFQHTYEGLKPMQGTANPAGTLGFQHTYEGLKLRQLRIVILANPSFQHTYEGLKHRLDSDLRRLGWGFQHTYEGLKLPQTVTGAGLVPGFSAYLWGIET